MSIFSNGVEKLPIPQISKPEQQPFIDLVDKILAAKKAGQDTRAWEQQIDTLVYALYDLTPEEIAIVESQAKPAAANG
ncbi:hypothetical protein [Methylocucumis oryzae]|uniref:hypothetical protein n=1 Tax=Methylocucumis oryzae TaxID=1632867 RepID=UPI0009E28E80|nr:hypothetical protein [Methylocucumis oryzae]